MNSEIKTEWVRQLRSGKYRQGQHALAWVGRYCALGVYCEVVSSEADPARDHSEGGYEDLMSDEPCGVPLSVLARGRLHEADAWQIIDLNDTEGRSFRQIADWIERHL
jgi:hypothetical protein